MCGPMDLRAYATYWRHIAESTLTLCRSMAADELNAQVVDAAMALANRAMWIAQRLEDRATDLEKGIIQ